ncbi:MAG: ATP-binding cassette domain-containing protein, partial [Chitinivibrionales bacterium]|nr:ATP-binding cassette domain-containing protein [Chitinivibrionales bacterium]
MSNQPVIEVKNLSSRYGDRTVLRDVSFSVTPSEIRIILGKSGCGKTTLMKNIIGLLKPISGIVHLFGVQTGDLDSESSVAVVKNIGILFQNGALLGSLTVGENVALPLSMHSAMTSQVIEEIVRLKLAQVGLPNTYHLYPQQLSGGMRKRASLARALALEPKLLFCDEPSAGLDPVTASGIDELLLTLRKEMGITIVVITHELLSINRIADTVLFLDRGEVLFDGTLREA